MFLEEYFNFCVWREFLFLRNIFTHSILQLLLLQFAARQFNFFDQTAKVKPFGIDFLVKKFKTIDWQPQKQGEFCLNGGTKIFHGNISSKEIT